MKNIFLILVLLFITYVILTYFMVRNSINIWISGLNFDISQISQFGQGGTNTGFQVCPTISISNSSFLGFWIQNANVTITGQSGNMIARSAQFSNLFINRNSLQNIQHCLYIYVSPDLFNAFQSDSVLYYRINYQILFIPMSYTGEFKLRDLIQ